MNAAAATANGPNLNAGDLERLHSFRIPDELITLHQVERVTSQQARDLGIHYHGDLAGVVWPVSKTDYVLAEPARCPNCKHEITEKTLVARKGD